MSEQALQAMDEWEARLNLEEDIELAATAQYVDPMRAIYEARHEDICKSYEKYMEIMQSGADPAARASFAVMLLSNTQALIASAAGDT